MSGIPRSIEAMLALAALLLISPLILLAGLLVLCTSTGPIFFRQIRMGRHGEPFLLYKLRTMRKAEGGPQITARDDDRMTWIGKILRKTKIDELPELWNVLRGDMSLVGPRPEVPRYVNLENQLWNQVLQARPGITDPVTLRLRNEEELLAGVQGDRETFYQEVLLPYKLKGYVDYLGERSCWSDVIVLLKTLHAVIIPSKAPLLNVADLASPQSQNAPM
jgi:lipopolysaccharide/colanic/teichoic acid biosynthesis glycosyltransferase